jgi:hypothetical protein
MTTDDIKQDLRNLRQHIATLRDEVRVNLHLAGMDARSAWEDIEQRLAEAERARQRTSETLRDQLRDLVVRLRALRDATRSVATGSPPRPPT